MGDEDDEEGGQPSKYEFSEESKLDEDHLFYLQFTNNFISNVTRPRDFDHCSRWLEKLAGEPMYGVEAKRNRNMFLAMLLVAMQDNKVKGPFATFPPPGNLPNAALTFGLVSDEERMVQADMAFDLYDRELNMTDYKFKSEDGRTYVATSSLPESSGVMAYLGITYGGGEGLWLNKDGEKVSLTDIMCGDRVPTIDTTTPIKKQVEMIQAYQWDEPPPEGWDDDAWPFEFLDKLPESRSDSQLVHVVTEMSPQNLKFLKEVYSEDVICKLEKLLVKSKKMIDDRLRARHNRVVEQIYKSYGEEVERGLLEFKMARKEWHQVMVVIQSLKTAEKEMSEKEDQMATSSSDMLKMLSDTYNEALSRKRRSYEESQLLQKHREAQHKDIHDRALIHKHELETLEGHVSKLIGDIRKLRNDNRRKQQVIESLVNDLKEKERALASG